MSKDVKKLNDHIPNDGRDLLKEAPPDHPIYQVGALITTGFRPASQTEESESESEADKDDE